MANTVIQLKKSAVPNEIPSNLANGEIAINYADGKLFYKDAFGAIQQISSGGNTFSTINAAGTLLVSDLASDILNIVAGNNIEITADALTDTFTITANLSNVTGGGGATVTTSDTAPGSPGDGDLWYNTTIGKILVYYDDGSSSQWVEASTGQIYTDAILAGVAYSRANDSYSLAQTAFDRANTSNDVLFIVGAYDTANAAFDKANAANLLAYGTGIGANAYADSVGTAANANLSVATIAANSYTDSVGTAANNFAGSMSNASNAYAASLTPDLSPVFLVANAAFDKANAANVLAYNALPKTGGTVAGDLVVTGNVTISGETTYANTQTLLIGDNIFVMNADLPNNVAPSEDAGMEVNRGSSTNVTLNWRESTDKWVFTNDGTTYVNVASNTDIENVGTAANNFAGAMANASNAYADSLTPDLSPVFLVANAAFDKANAANVLACTAFDAANTKVSSVTGTAGQIFSSGGTTPTLNLITTAVTSAIYGGSTQIPVINIDSYGRITSASNVSVQGMDYAYVNSSIDIANAYSRVFANSVGTAANAYTDTVVAANLVTARSYANTKVDTITSNSTSRIWANSVTASGIETVYMDLATSGVSAATYGASDTVVPYFTVDAYGRITAAGNTTVANAKTMLANTSGTVFAGDLNVTGNLTIDSTSFFLDKNANRVGIGTTSPSATLDVVGTLNTSKADILNQTLTDGASIAWDTALGQIATVTLGGNRALANASNLKVGTYILHVVQDGSGGRTLSYGSQYKWPGGVAPTLTTTIGARDLISFVSDGTLMYGSFLPDVK